MARILIVDDDEQTAATIARLLERAGHDCVAVEHAVAAEKHLGDESVELVLCDMNLPSSATVDFMRHVMGTRFDIAVMLLADVEDPSLAHTAVEYDAYGFVVKPFKATELLINVANALRRRTLEQENQGHRETLVATLRERVDDVWAAIARGEDGAPEQLRLTVDRLARASQVGSDPAERDLERAGDHAAALAVRAGLDEERASLIGIATCLRDIGRCGVPDRVLRKRGAFLPEEFAAMTQHPELGRSILAGSDVELLTVAADIAWTHHERWDGSGYPRGLVAAEIPLEGRIASIVDVFDALTSTRGYRAAYARDKAVSTIWQAKGKHFDPELVDVFVSSLDEIAGPEPTADAEA